MTLCDTCYFRRKLPGDAHISCSNPPVLTATLKHKKKESRQKAVVIILEKCKEEGLSVIIRRTWNKCGIFPLCYDSKIVVACSNYEELKR